MKIKGLKEIFTDIQSIIAILGFIGLLIFTAIDLLLFGGVLDVVTTFRDVIVTIIAFYFAQKQVKKELKEIKEELEKK
jgi:hypothetical protein